MVIVLCSTLVDKVLLYHVKKQRLVLLKIGKEFFCGFSTVHPFFSFSPFGFCLFLILGVGERSALWLEDLHKRNMLAEF